MRSFPGRADLSEDLALTQHDGVEAGRNLEEVRDGGGVVLAVEVGRQFVDGQIADLAEEVPHVAVGAMEQLGDDVDLGAVARGEYDGLTDVVTNRKSGDGFAQLLGQRGSAAPAAPRGYCGG